MGVQFRMARLSSLGRGDNWVVCIRCTHSSWLRLDDVLAKFGDAQVSDVERRLICDNCKTRHASIQGTRPRPDPKRLRLYKPGARLRGTSKEVSFSGDRLAIGRPIDLPVPSDEPQGYRPGSSAALTLRDAAEQIAYCYTCQNCGHKARVDLRIAASRLTPETQVGDLSRAWPCERCGDKKKITNSLWLKATTTTQTLEALGYPVWPDDDASFFRLVRSS